MAKSPPDGYNLVMGHAGPFVSAVSLYAKTLPYDPLKDFAPVSMVATGVTVLVVHPSVPVSSAKEFIAYVKQNPGKVNYASQGNGSLSHVGTELFDQTTHTEMTHVPYKGSGPAIQDVLSGQVQVFMTTPPSVMGHVQSGKLKAFAVTSKTRHPMLPEVPTTAEAGLPGFELEAWVGLFAPAGTPPDVIARLSEGVKKALELPETRKRAETLGIEAHYLGPDALAALVRKDTEYWGKVIKARNIKAD